MLQKQLMLIISAVAGAGLLGMLIAYLIYGKIGGDCIQPGTLFSPGSVSAGADPALAGMDAIREKVFLGGVAGALIGLVAPVLIAHGKSILEG